MNKANLVPLTRQGKPVELRDQSRITNCFAHTVGRRAAALWFRATYLNAHTHNPAKDCSCFINGAVRVESCPPRQLVCIPRRQAGDTFTSIIIDHPTQAIAWPLKRIGRPRRSWDIVQGLLPALCPSIWLIALGSRGR